MRKETEDECIRHILEKLSAGERNPTDGRLVTFSDRYRLMFTNTDLRHKRNLVAWCAKDDRTVQHIDHILVHSPWVPLAGNCRVWVIDTTENVNCIVRDVIGICPWSHTLPLQNVYAWHYNLGQISIPTECRRSRTRPTYGIRMHNAWGQIYTLWKPLTNRSLKNRKWTIMWALNRWITIRQTRILS